MSYRRTLVPRAADGIKEVFMRFPRGKTHQIRKRKPMPHQVYLILIPISILFGPSSCSAQTDWELLKVPILRPGRWGEWDCSTVCDPAIIFDNGLLHMWYTGLGTGLGIGYATSENGLDWIKYEGNPVITSPGTVGHPTVMKRNDLFIIFFSGTKRMGDNKRISMGSSIDGIHWRFHPALDLGKEGEWDDNNVYNPFVIHDGVRYRMYYSGEDGSGTWRIGVATSPDGRCWVRHGSNPVLHPDPYYEWDSQSVNNPCVHFDGETYHMWYSGRDNLDYSVGYAVSTDGFTWEKHPENPVITAGPPHSWHSARVDPGVAFEYKQTFYMAPSGTDGSKYFIGMGISTE